MPVPTGFYDWTVPEEYDPPDGPVQFTELANDIAATVRAIDLRVVNTETRLTSLETAVEETRPLVQVRQTVAQGILHLTQPPITMEAEDFDTHGMHSTSVDTSRLTCVVPGVYLVWGVLSLSGNATGRRFVYINFKGAAVAQCLLPNAGTQQWQGAAPTVAIRMAVGDYVELVGSHEAGSGISLTTVVSSIWHRPMLGARWIAP